MKSIEVIHAGEYVGLIFRNMPFRGTIEAVKKDNQSHEIVTKSDTIFALYPPNSYVK